MTKTAGGASGVISLPQGGGALRGIGETFAPDLHTGTGNFTVPIALPPGRNGFQPSLNFVYSTGNGNGPFGLGWSLNVPGVSRKTSKGVPRYDDRDVFLLSGAEDLVPVQRDGRITRYQPRTEGLFARIRHIQGDGDDYWEVCSKDGLISLYGTPGASNADPAVVADPDPVHPEKVFAWRLTETRDPFGNHISYSYRADAGDAEGHRWNQPLLHQIRYGDYEEGGKQRFLVSVTFDYEPRPDPFSDYRSTFEIRTSMRCRSITIATHADVERVQRVYHLVYQDQRSLEGLALPPNGVSLLSQIWVEGRDESSSELLANPAFVTVGPVGPATSLPVGTGGDPSAAARWTTWRNRPSTLSTWLEPSAFLPAGVQMIHVATDEIWGGLVQLFGNPGSGPSSTTASAWIFVRRGRVGIGAGDGGNTSIDAVTQTTGSWEYLSVAGHAPANEFAIYAASEGGAEYYVASASVSVTPRSEWLPPLEFGYSVFVPEQRHFAPIVGADLPARSLANPELELADLTGDGLPDILELNGTARYWRNLGGGRFDWPRTMRDAPPLALADAGVQLLDANGDGRIDLLVSSETQAGFYSLEFDGTWSRRSFQRYAEAPSFSLEDPEVKLVDLDGDGVTDAIRAGSRMECFFSDPQRGWLAGPAIERQSLEVFPNVSFSDPRVKWGDMSGDGLQDILQIHEGSVAYWPNLGRGRWGRRIQMRNSPRFHDQGYTAGFDPRRILLGDVDGDGLADIVYVGDGKVTLWINQSGNSWSRPITIQGTPAVTDLGAVRLVDLYGIGISGLLWSADTQGNGRPHLFFLDFTGSVKPYLLNSMDNHIGAITNIEYAPSTRDLLHDQQKPATRWRTPLPFPVQVVARVQVIDDLSKSRLTTEYRYHHGCWDGAEREFRGFGMVEQLDTETFVSSHGSAAQERHYSPPTLTRTWFHQGSVGEEFGDWRELDYTDEYWSGDAQRLGHVAGVNRFLQNYPQAPKSRRIRRDALRTLRGTIMRNELYALDRFEGQTHIGPADRPYIVTEHAYSLIEISPPNAGNEDRVRVFFPHAVAQRTTHWERGADPLTQFTFTDYLDEQGLFDPYGRPNRQAQIACPRGWRQLGDRADSYLATRNVTRYAAPIRPDEQYIHDRAASVTSYAITNRTVAALPGGDVSRTLDELTTLADNDPALQVIGQTLSYYDFDEPTSDWADIRGLPLGQIGRYGALVRTESLVLTETIMSQAYAAVPPYLQHAGAPAWTSEYPQQFRAKLAGLPGQAGYTYIADADHTPGFYIQPEQRRYDFHQSAAGDGRGLVLAKRGPLGEEVQITFDRYDVLPTVAISIVDSASRAALTTTAEYNYRVLQPTRVVDPNGSETRFDFSPLGLLQQQWMWGHPQRVEGDRKRPSLRLDYNFWAYAISKRQNSTEPQPIFAHTTRQVYHDADLPTGQVDERIESREYSDGFGRLLQTRTQAEDVLFGERKLGNDVIPIDQAVTPGPTVGRRRTSSAPPNVTVSSWQVYDNKGRVVEKFEPFFDEGWSFQQEEDATQGVHATLFYDPRGRVIRTLNPDGSEQRVVYGVPGQIRTPDLNDPTVFEPSPWEVYTYDANDNAGRTHAGEARGYEHHWDTPSSALVDALGRTIESVERNRAARRDLADPLPPIEAYRTILTYDIRGNLLSVTDPLERPAFSYTYDLANQPIQITSIDAGERRNVLDAAGNMLEQRDSNGALTLRVYDQLSRPTHLWASDGVGQQLSLREFLIYGDQLGQSVTSVQNLRGQLYQHYDEAGRVMFTQYDFKGNLLEKQRQVIDPDHIMAVFAGAAGAGWQISAYRVDWEPPAGQSLDAYANTVLQPTPYETSTTYDALNRVTSLLYSRDVDNQRKLLRPSYNHAGALESVSFDGETYVERIAYNANGQRTLVAYGNGVMTRYAYDTNTFRLTRMRTERFSHPGDEPLIFQPLSTPLDERLLQELAYQYDRSGTIVSINDLAPRSGLPGRPTGLRRIFSYDPLYRLLSANGRECVLSSIPLPWEDSFHCDDATRTRLYTQTYRYDAAGNLLELSHSTGNGGSFTRTFSYRPGSNRLATMTIGQDTYAYTTDANGNLISETTSRHLEWDHADRLKVYRTQTSGAEPTKHAHYLYDAAGQRVMKLVRDQGGAYSVTIYVDGVFEHYRWGTRPNEQNNILHVMDNQSRIAMRRVGNPAPDDGTTDKLVTYHLGDHLGSSSLVIGGADARGAMFISREEFYPYGETSFGSYGRKRYRFTGKERDEESGMYYHGARYYAPWLGRWASCDPAGIVDGVNLYRYATSEPISGSDPTGMRTENDRASPMTVSTNQPANSNHRVCTSCHGTDAEYTTPFLSIGDYSARLLDQELEWDPNASKWDTLSADEFGKMSPRDQRQVIADLVGDYIAEGAKVTYFPELPGPLGIVVERSLSDRAVEYHENMQANFAIISEFCKQLGSGWQGMTPLHSGLGSVSTPKSGSKLVKGEYVYRRMSFDEASDLLKSKPLQASKQYKSEAWVSTGKRYAYNYPTKTGIGNYDVVVRFKLKPGTLDWLQGVARNKIERGTLNFGIPRLSLKEFNARIQTVDVFSTQPTMLDVMRNVGNVRKPVGWRYR